MSGGPIAEKEPVQKIIMSVASLGFIGLLIVPALDHRFTWSHLPPYVALAGDVLCRARLGSPFFSYSGKTASLPATIELAQNQKVISTGPYALVRHPMYVGGLVMMLGMPIALGSVWGLLIIAAIIPALAWRPAGRGKIPGQESTGLFGVSKQNAVFAWCRWSGSSSGPLQAPSAKNSLMPGSIFVKKERGQSPFPGSLLVPRLAVTTGASDANGAIRTPTGVPMMPVMQPLPPTAMPLVP